MFLDDENAKKRYKATESRATFLIALAAATACIFMVFGLMGVAKAELPIARDTSGAAVTRFAGPAVEMASLSAATQPAATESASGNMPALHQTMDGRGLLMAAVAGAFGLTVLGGRALWRNNVSRPLRTEADRRRD